MTRDAEYTAFAQQAWPNLVRSAALLGASRTEAEDLAQTALIKCYVAWRKVRVAENQDAYAYGVLLNVFRDARRRHWKGETPTAEFPEYFEHDQTARIDQTATVRQALRRLSEEHREVIVLRFYAHLDERQMAEALAVAPGTVKSRLSRAIRILATDKTLAESG